MTLINKKTFIHFMILMVATATISMGFAETKAIDDKNSNPQAPPPTPTNDGLTGEDSSVNTSTIVGKSVQGVGAAVSGGAGVYLITIGEPLLDVPATAAEGGTLIAMGTMALAQAAATMGGMLITDDAGKKSRTGGFPPYVPPGGPTNPLGPKNPNGDGGLPPQLQTELDKGLRLLKENGSSINPADGTITTPNGTFSADSLGTMSGLTSAGLSSDQAKSVLAALDQANKKAMAGLRSNVVAMPIDAGAGGSAPTAHGLDADTIMNSYLSRLKKAGRNPASVAGLSVKFNGEPIAVGSANIFDVIHNCYKKKRAGQEYIEGASR